MKKTSKTTTKKRTQVKDLPAPTKEMTKKEKEKVRGGIIHMSTPEGVDSC
jgi:hypothetical protein